MPRTISVRRKYLPALSREVSLPSSQRSLRGSRKPWGGGPAGVAARREVLVKVADGIVVRGVRKAVRGIEVGRTRASAIRERADAILKGVENSVVANGEFGGERKCECGNDESMGSDWLNLEHHANRN